ncbi:aminoglycoside adenylyltransferase domain-containing protein [Paenibacillus sp. BC26]|uniref:aminoglycoside adenylyltransferase domain-containing protein n=1 Tax=Paenibacillus sp. BC26 TaxID=1881032 RepID=UPI0008E0F093|nr:aminoglycoside adenylyltransferase domain-containing protein [Paenibacillus sp. BC26]SFS75267.1 Nucleotidyltransferase domain-containing protein [Paenibacillus sp. BC26]
MNKSMNNAMIPDELTPLMDDFGRLLRLHVPHLVHGLYLQGSIALGGYQSMKSDIDVIVVLNQAVINEEDNAKITAIHEELHAKQPFHLAVEGLYTSLAHLSKNAEPAGETFPRLSHGGKKSLHTGYVDATSAWILKNHGIAVFGPEASELGIVVEWDEIRGAMNYNLNVYWAGKANRAELYMDEEWIEFAVLTLARIVYTMEHSSIITKLDAGLYLLQQESNRWHRVVREAVQIRSGGTGGTLYSTDLERAQEVQQFVQTTIAECNAKYHF